ncbi:MAG: hypothetical protein AB7N76_16990 [Planctomycetota bacterium]
MSLLDKIKSLFGRTALPEETRVLLSGVADVEELRQGLDEIVTRNEVEARDIEREIEKLARMENAQKERIQGGSLNDREKTNILREIKRLRRRMDSLEKRHRIHQDNIDLHLGLFDRITEMQAMEMKKVSQAQIEELSADYDEAMEKHRDLMATARAASGMESLYEDSAEQAELAALEAEILAEVSPEDEAAAEEEALAAPLPEPVKEPAPVKAPAAKEPAAREPAAREPVAKEPAAKEPVAKEAQKTPATVEAARAAASAARRRSLDEELARLEAELADEDLDDEEELDLE